MLTFVNIRIPWRTAVRPKWPLMRVVAIGQFICALIFSIDIAFELHNQLLDNRSLTRWQIAHLATETFAVALLLLGFFLSQKEMRRLTYQAARQCDTLAVLRGHFDDILLKRFEAWGLSNAERDIALLSLRGLKISEIAGLRKTKEGTIKAQLSAIFHKAGIGTRTELLGLFMDEFLDFGATQNDNEPPSRRSEHSKGTHVISRSRI